MSHLPVSTRRTAEINGGLKLDSVGGNGSGGNGMQTGTNDLDNATSPSIESGTTATAPTIATPLSQLPVISPSLTLDKRRKSIKPSTTPTPSRHRKQSVSSLHSSVTAVAKSQQDNSGGWNSSKSIHEKPPPSESIKRSKSYASSLKKSKSGNIVVGSIASSNADESSDNNPNNSNSAGPEFVNGQHRTARALAARVAELEVLLDTAHRDLSYSNTVLETVESDHRYQLDSLKMDMKRMVDEKDAMMQMAKNEYEATIATLEDAASDLRLKCKTQLNEIEKLHARSVAAVQASAAFEIEVVALRAEREVWRGQTKLLQAEIGRLQGEAHKVAERELETEVRHDAELADLKKSAAKDVSILQNEHTTQIKSIESEYKNIIFQNESNLENLNNNLTLQMKKLSDANTKIEYLESRLRTTEQALEKEKISHSETITKNELEMNESTAKFNATIIEKDSTMEEMNSKIAFLSQTLAITKKSESNFLTQLNDTTEELAATKLNFETTNSDFKKAIESNAAEVESLKNDFNTALAVEKTTIVALNDQISSVSHSLKQTESNVEHLESNLIETRQLLEQTKQTLDETMAQNEAEIKDLNVQFNNTLLSKESIIRDLSGEVSKLQNKEAEAKLTLNLAETTRELKTVRAELVEKIAENELNVQTHISEIDAQRSEFDT
ncbi:hypothetical protein HK100_000865, partial [Physocladia obscura]